MRVQVKTYGCGPNETPVLTVVNGKWTRNEPDETIEALKQLCGAEWYEKNYEF